MDEEIGTAAGQSGPVEKSLQHSLLLAFQSFGVVYGDLSTSPLYVFKTALSGNLQNYRDELTIFGLFSLIFWTLTLLPLLKYVIIVLAADYNGEGGTFALYSLLCRHAKLSLLPNQQAADEELSTYYQPGIGRTAVSSPFKRFLEKHRNLRTCLLLFVLFGACMVIGDGVLTPTISVLSAISGLQDPGTGGLGDDIGLFSFDTCEHPIRFVQEWSGQMKRTALLEFCRKS